MNFSERNEFPAISEGFIGVAMLLQVRPNVELWPLLTL